MTTWPTAVLADVKARTWTDAGTHAVLCGNFLRGGRNGLAHIRVRAISCATAVLHERLYATTVLF
jgi:hypothetical protein